MSTPGKPSQPNLASIKDAFIIDGDPAMQSMVGNYLKKASVDTVHKFSNGNDALKALDETPCDLIMLDWKLKNPSGPDVYKAIRANPNFEKTPILLISGAVTAADIQIAQVDRQAKFIVKPFTEEILLSYVVKFVGAVKQAAAADAAKKTATARPAGSQQKDDGGVQVLKGSGNGAEDKGLVKITGSGSGKMELQVDKGSRKSGNGTEVMQQERIGAGPSATQSTELGKEFTAKQERPQGTDMEFKQERNNGEGGDFSAVQKREAGQDFEVTQERGGAGSSMDAKYALNGVYSPQVDGDLSSNPGASGGVSVHASAVLDTPPPAEGVADTAKGVGALDSGSEDPSGITSGKNLALDSDSEAPAPPKKLICTANVLGTQLPIPVPTRALVVDQDEAQQKLLTQYFAEMGAEHTTVSGDSTSAWRTIQSESFDIVVMDWKLKGLGGLALYSRIRDHRDFGRMPIIVMAGLAHKGDFRLLGESNYTSFLEKPIKKVRFDAIVKDTLINVATNEKVTTMVAGLIDKMNGDSKKTLQLVEGMVKNISNPMIFVVAAGQYLLQKNDLELAEKVFNIARRMDGENVTVITELSKIYHRTGRPNNAKAMLSKAAVISPDSIERLFLMGEIGLTMQDPATARRHFEAALKIDGEHEKSLAGLVLANGMAENPLEGGAPAGDDKSGKPSMMMALASSLNAVAVTYVRNGEIAKAIAQYQAATCFVYDPPTLARLQFNLGMAYLRDKKVTEAKKWFFVSSGNAAADFQKPGVLIKKLTSVFGEFTSMPVSPTDNQINQVTEGETEAGADAVEDANTESSPGLVSLEDEFQIIDDVKDIA